MFIGPSTTSDPLEVGVVVIHALPARTKFLKGWWVP